MSHHPYYDRQGNPISAETWALMFEHEDRVLARTRIEDIVVSTVWLGINHQFGPTGPPLIFETMTFPDNPDVDEYCVRYSTEDEARAGHAALCTLMRHEQELQAE